MEWTCVAYYFACICVNIYYSVAQFIRPFMFTVTINTNVNSLVNLAYLIIQFNADSTRKK
jgi:hypothetical protein